MNRGVVLLLFLCNYYFRLVLRLDYGRNDFTHICDITQQYINLIKKMIECMMHEVCCTCI